MGGFFGVAGTQDCVAELFYGTDYHSHLGTKRGGLAVCGHDGIKRVIHDITNAQFRSKFDSDLHKLHGTTGIGIISDYEDQPLLIGSHLGTYAIATVGRINNSAELAARAFGTRTTHFSEMSGGEINPTELVATLINQEATFEDGIAHAQQQIDGSRSLLIMTPRGIYAARDRVGRTPVVIGRKAGAYAVAMESSAFPNLNYEAVRDVGPGEVVHLTAEGVEQKRPFVQYTPTWPRSVMPQDQHVRDLVRGQRMLFCDDSIVRGTQLPDTIRRLYDVSAREVHMRVACPPTMSAPIVGPATSRGKHRRSPPCCGRGRGGSSASATG